jgi:hypothetical protein
MKVSAELVEVAPGGTITFKNALTPPSDIEIRFFASIPDKAASTPTPISDFCVQQRGEFFEVKEKGNGQSGERICTFAVTSNADFYLYSVTAKQHNYAVLDPVIIIDKPGPVPFGTAVLIAAVLGGAVLGALGLKAIQKRSTKTAG